MSIKNSKKSFELMLNEWEQDKLQMQEEAKILLLNRNNNVLGIYSLAKGGLTSCVVDVRIILSIALKTLATGIILVHNHPSGNLKPSQADLDITKKLKQSCDLLDISFLDHLIITKDNYFSFDDEEIKLISSSVSSS
jgi:DNA repair protein RadC